MNRTNRDLVERLNIIARKYSKEIAKDLYLADEEWVGCKAGPKADMKIDDAWIRGAFTAELFPNILRFHIVRSLSMLNMAQVIHDEKEQAKVSPLYLDGNGQWQVRQ